VEQQTEQELGRIERRSRTLNGLVLGAVAFLATYGLMFYEGQIERPAFLFYPWLLGVLFYLAGDLLGLIWFRAIAAQLRAQLEFQRKQQEARRLAAQAGLLEPEPLSTDGVEVIRPGGR
jgi:hypothetical protein